MGISTGFSKKPDVDYIVDNFISYIVSFKERTNAMSKNFSGIRALNYILTN